jgi:fumarate reductase flavoprotein subunit
MGDLNTDIVVIGTGGAGMCAAVSAVNGSAKVIVFEKANYPGGTTNMAGGIFAADSKMQHQAGITYTRDEAFKMFMDYVHWRVNARLVKAFIDRSASTIEWLENNGVEFVGEPQSYNPECYRTVHSTKGRGLGHGGTILVQTLMNRAKDKGAEIHFATPVRKIVKDRERIIGVIAEDESGNTIQVNSKAVIIATGGFAANKDMIKQYSGFDLGRDLIILHNLKLTGDGIQMAWEVGAAAEAMGPHLCGKNIPGPGIEGARPWIVKNQLRIAEGQPHLWINQQGERFLDEGIVLNNPYTSNALVKQKNKCAYVIFDENIRKHMEEVGVDFEWNVWPGKKIIDLDGQVQQCIDEGNENVFMANSMEELGNKINVHPGVLQNTVHEYNECCEKGHDDLFGKNPKYLRPIKQPKFYALRVVPIAYGTLGGIKINEKTEVLDENNEVIPGLYAAGNDACGLFGDPPTYDYIHLAGGALGFAVNSGCIAGENALNYIGK